LKLGGRLGRRRMLVMGRGISRVVELRPRFLANEDIQF
jgi:hypothetical protein